MAQTTIKTEQLEDDVVTVAKMAANSVDSDQYVDGSIDTAHYADNSITGAELADNIAIAGTLDVAGAVVFNEGSADVDFRVESNANANMLFVDGGNNRVGIGTASPIVEFEAMGTFGAAATSGSATGFIARFSQSSGVGSLDFGFGDPYSWLQSRNSGNYATNYNLVLQPNGGNVGIGTTANISGYNLHVHEPAGGSAAGYIKVSSAGTGAAGGDGLDIISGHDGVGYLWNRESQALVFGTSNAERMRITSAGNVGIGTTSPQQKLHVAGAIRLSATGTDANRWNVYYNSSTGDLILVSSDARLKKDFDYSISGIETVNKLKPVRYTWKDSNKRQLGFTAQESIEADEHLAWNNVEDDTWGLDGWEGYAAVLTKAIQEQQVIIDDLKARLKTIEDA